MPEAMAQPGLCGPDSGHAKDSNPAPSKPPVKESSYYMDNYEATVTVHTSPPQQFLMTQAQQLPQTSGDFLEIDDETRDLPESKLVRNKLSKKKNLRVTFSDHIEVDLIPDLCDEVYDDVDGDVSEDLVIEESVYELVKTPGSNKITKGAKLKEPIQIQTQKPLIFAQGSPELKIAKESASPNRSPPGSPRKSEPRSKISSPKSNKVTSHSSSPPLLQRRRISQSSMTESEKTTKDYIHELRERRQTQNQKQAILNTLLPSLNTSSKSRSQPSYSNFLSDAKRAVDRANFVNDRPWTKRQRSPEKPVYGLYNRKQSDMTRSAGTVRKTTSLPRNFRLPETLYSGRYRRPGSDNTLLNLGVK